MRTYSGFTECYTDLLRLVMCDPHHVCRPGEANRPKGRGGGQEIRERLCQGFMLSDPRDRLALVPARDLSVSYVVAELLWYLSGSDSTEWIGYYAPFWRNITDDGTTANSAYGARIFRNYHSRIHGGIPGATESGPEPRGQSQWDYVKSELKRDPESRRAVLQIRSAQDSWLADKDVPCTLALQFFLRDGKLHLVVTMRSSDAVLGIPYDVAAFTTFQELMALELGVGLGTYMHVSNSLHVYERDFEMVERILTAPSARITTAPMPPMPCQPPIMTLSAVESLLRECTDSTMIMQRLEDSRIALGPTGDYWQDWIKVLASNRAGKLGLKDQQRALLDSTQWHGYSTFSR